MRRVLTMLVLAIVLEIALASCNKRVDGDPKFFGQRFMAIALDVDRKQPFSHDSAFDDEVGATRNALAECQRSEADARCRSIGSCNLRGYAAVAVGSVGGLTWGVSCGFTSPLDANREAIEACHGKLPWFGKDCEVRSNWSQQ